jgi:hypothetical protein
MGIGGPLRPAGATELVALSPGLLDVATSPARLSPQGFPEPPPPPGAVEELDGDWEVTETPALPRSEAAPESVDDFAEELPPSLPPPDEELPSSTGTPSLQSLAHHHEHTPPKPNADDFLANMSAAMNGGMMASSAGAPTIDVSSLASAPADANPTPDVALSTFDVPLSGKQTLPLFALADDEAKTPTPRPRAKPAAAPAPRSPNRAEGSLSPAAVDQPNREAPRERRNVVAPATKSVPPAAALGAQRRSGLAAPLLLALAAAAGFLIWKRTAAAPGPATPEPVSTPAQMEAPAAPTAPVAPSESLAPAVSAAPAPAADDITFETTPTPTKAPAATVASKATPSAPSEATGDARPTPAVAPSEPKPALGEPAAKDEPKLPPVTPAEPAGPFDRAAAAAALTSSAAQASSCRKEGDPSGVASVVITFAPSGRVTSANISGPPFAGTPTGGCIAAALRKARIPAFEGERVTVSKTVVIQ